MMKYSTEERIQMIKWFYGGNSSCKIRSLFAVAYPDRPIPARTTVHSVVKNFETRGCVSPRHHKKVEVQNEDRDAFMSDLEEQTSSMSSRANGSDYKVKTEFLQNIKEEVKEECPDQLQLSENFVSPKMEDSVIEEGIGEFISHDPFGNLEESDIKAEESNSEKNKDELTSFDMQSQIGLVSINSIKEEINEEYLIDDIKEEEIDLLYVKKEEIEVETKSTDDVIEDLEEDKETAESNRINGRLKSHQLPDTEEKTNECDICLKNFSYKSDLKRHLLIHTGEKPYKCNVCLKTFTQSNHLKEHLRIHTGEKPYECNTCPKNFSHKSDLKKHLLIHTGEKPYKCDVCHKSFSRKSFLNAHHRIHTGEKPYKCTICDKAFSQNGYLKKHLLIHTEEKRYGCHTAFTQNIHLKEHFQIHIDEKP